MKSLGFHCGGGGGGGGGHAKQSHLLLDIRIRSVMSYTAVS